MRRTLVISLALGLGGSALAAQTIDSSKAIAGWRDSIAQWPIDSVQAEVDRTGAPKSPLDRLHTGWLLLTLGGLTDTAGLAARAMDQFYEVTVRRPRWVEGWYGLGMAKVALLSAGAREIRSPHQTAGTGWAQGAANAFLQAQRVDPPFLPAAIALAKLTPQLRDRASAREIERRLDQAVAADGTDPSLWLLVADAATARGDDAGAVAALQKAGGLPGAPAGTIRLALARAHFALGDTAAAV
ncbi:MAG TPA: hypothetical protein VFI13_12305, partial [Gemmatimonadales bacterium]|nr:hypothetical protein [Gemmatimonadales bacterium]